MLHVLQAGNASLRIRVEEDPDPAYKAGRRRLKFMHAKNYLQNVILTVIFWHKVLAK
jgi:hypothetical protein